MRNCLAVLPKRYMCLIPLQNIVFSALDMGLWTYLRYLIFCRFGWWFLSFGFFIFSKLISRVWVWFLCSLGLGFLFSLGWFLCFLFVLQNQNHPMVWPTQLTTRTFSRPRVQFLFTQFNWVECELAPNPIQPDPWTTLLLSLENFCNKVST